MHTATLNHRFANYETPTRTAPSSLKSISKIDDLEEDIHLFRVLYPTNHLPPGPTPVPERRHPVLDVDRMVVSASIVRRIENELLNDECDPHTVFNACRGMTRGTLEFEDAYFAARVRAFAKSQRMVRDPFLCTRSNTEDLLLNPHWNIIDGKTPPPPHPMAVIHLGHLMSHFGIWVMGLLGIQFLTAWRVSAFASAHLDGGRYFYFAIAVFLFLAINSVVWFRRRGNLCDAFFAPGIALYLMALLPVFILHVRTIMMAR